MGSDQASFMDLPSVYISSPYTNPSPGVNVNSTVAWATLLANTGKCYPVMPLLVHLWDSIIPHEYEFWIAYTRRMLVDCDALLRLPGESQGADGEVAMAASLGIPVFSSYVALAAWLGDR